MNKYRVTTGILEAFKFGEILTETDNDGWFYNSDGSEGLRIEIIERNPDWFKKIDPEWEVYQHGIIFNDDVDESVRNGLARQYISNGRVDIDLPHSITNRQAEAICNALNEPANESQ